MKSKYPGLRKLFEEEIDADIAEGIEKGINEKLAERVEEKLAERVEEKLAERVKEELAERVEETTADHLMNIINKLKYTAEQAMDLLSIPPVDRKMYADLVGKRLQ